MTLVLLVTSVLTNKECHGLHLKNSLQNRLKMIIETAIQIDFECLVPEADIKPDKNGTYSFIEVPVYSKKEFVFEALNEFLDIPRLTLGCKMDRNPGEMTRVKQTKKRSDAREKFYKNWGFLTSSNEDTQLSENEAVFDAYQLELCKLNDLRKLGKLKDTSDVKFSPPATASWKVREYGNTNLPVPVYQPKDLATALYLTWFFSPKEMAELKTCLRFIDYGPKVGCQVFFEPKSNKSFCCDTCKKNHHSQKRKTQNKEK